MNEKLLSEILKYIDENSEFGFYVISTNSINLEEEEQDENK